MPRIYECRWNGCERKGKVSILFELTINIVNNRMEKQAAEGKQEPLTETHAAREVTQGEEIKEGFHARHESPENKAEVRAAARA